MSIQTINGSIISNYPVFEGSQVLTSEQLNGMFDYLDQQNRFTRSRLIGIGIVCGLHLKTVKNQVILSEGMGITSDGFIVKMPDCTMSYQRDYFLPSTVAYEAFGSYDSDNIFTQDDDIILCELLSKKPSEGQYQDLTIQFLEDKYLLIFLECFDRDPRSCLGKNCEDLGKERIFTTRKLAVDQKGLNRILSRTNGGVENAFFPTSELIRVDLKKPVFNPDGDECREVKSFVMHFKDLLYESGNPECVHHLLFGQGEATGLLQATYPEFQPLLEPAYNYKNPFDSNTDFNKVKSALRSYLAGGTGDNLKGVQDVYEFYELLIATYHDFMNVAAKIAQSCCPQKDFSLHLIIGKVVWDVTKEADEWNLLGQSRYRHQFLQPKILNSQAVLLKELISIHRKILLLVESFQINVIKEKAVKGVDETIKITPLDPDAGAIPRYLVPTKTGSVSGIQTTNLETEWHFDATVTGETPIRVRSYDRNRITHSTLFPAQQNFVTAPLHFQTSESTFKAEAIFGEDLGKVLEGEGLIRDTYHLPFTIIPVQINPDSSNILVEPRYWQDLQTVYNVTKGELNVTFKNIIGHLKDFERAAQGIDYGLTAVNVYNFKIEVDHVLTEIATAEGLVDQANKLVLELPVRIEDFYDNGASNNPFQVYHAEYIKFRRELHKSYLRLRYASEVLVREKIEVLENDLFHIWNNWIQRTLLGFMDFLSNNDFFQLHKLYYSFVARYKFLQENHYSILCNFLKLHPGIDFSAIRNDGTHILIYDESEETGEGVKEPIVFANFTLPYRLDPNQIHIPLDDDLEQTKLPPLARGESILLEQGQIRLIDSTANDLEPNGEFLRVDSKGSVKDDVGFVSGTSYHGGKVISHSGINSLLRYEPLKSFNGVDHFQYTVESESDNSLQDTAYVEVLVVPPYRKHIKAVDDLAATNNHHSVTISVLDNDLDYPGTEVIIPAKSSFGADLNLLSDNRIVYKPIYGREGKDTFKYTLKYEFMSDAGLQVEVTEAEVAVIVFCCNRMEFEVLCKGNQGEFQVLTAREIDDKSKLTLINEDGEPVERIEIGKFHFIEVREKDGVSYLFYQPDLYFKGKETYVYEVTDSEGFMRRVKLEVLVMPCTKAFSRRVLRDTMTDFEVLEGSQSDLFLYEGRNSPVSGIMKTAHGEVKTNGVQLRYYPNPEYVGLDFFEFGFNDDAGITHYNTMQVIVDGTEKVHVESTFQDTPAIFNVLSADMTSGYSLKLYANKDTFLEKIDTGEGRLITVDEGDIHYTPKTSFVGDDSFHYVILKDGIPFEYGKFYIIVDTNRKVQVAYTLRDLPKDIQVLTGDQVDARATLDITTPPTIAGAEAEVLDSGGDASFVRYTPADSYVGQDSFGYVITVGDVKLYGTVYVIVDSNERIELVNVYRNKSQRIQLFNPSQKVGEFDILQAPTHGSLTKLPGNDQQYIPEEDFTGSDKFKYRAQVGGSIQYGTVFIMITCECEDIVVTGTVSENAPTFPSIDNVRVEELGTGKHVFTGVSGVYSIQTAPNAILRFTKDTYETLDADVAYKSTLNVEMDRKEILIKGLVTNADTAQPLQDVQIINQHGNTFTDTNGDYSLVVYAGTRIDYIKNRFVSENRNSGTVDSTYEVAMEQIKVRAAGGVYDAFGQLIKKAYYQVSGKPEPTEAGSFDLEVVLDTDITFSAEGYDTETYIADTNREGLRVILSRSLVSARGVVSHADTGETLELVAVNNGETTVHTDTKGFFEISAIPGGFLDIIKRGFLGTSVLAPEVGENMKIELEPVESENHESVSGKVNMRIGDVLTPIQDASFELDGQVYTTNSGIFNFAAKPGTTVIFRAPGFQPGNMLVNGTVFKVQIVLTRELTDTELIKNDPGKAVIEGIVIDGKEPLIGASVLIRETATGAITDFDGRFSFSQGAVGNTLLVRMTGFRSLDVPVEDLAMPLEIVLLSDGSENDNENTLSGRITDQDNNRPISGAVVTNGNLQATTDADGNYRLNVEPGTEIIFSAEKYIPMKFHSATASQMNVSLKRVLEGDQEIEITGTITVDGKPTKGDVTSVMKGIVVPTDSEGRYSIVTRAGDNLIFRASSFKIKQEREVTASSRVFDVSFGTQG